MKIIDKEEREAHASYILAEGLKGMFYGSVVSLGVYSWLKMRHPKRFASFNTSIKTCIIIMPTISLAAFYADEGSVEFDRKMYSSGYTNQKVLEEYREWQNLKTSDKIIQTLANNQYKIIFTSWLASMYGSWVYVNRDKVMTTPQKLVQARMYAQAITIVLLLSTIVLAMKTQELEKDKPKPIPEWKKILEEREAEKDASDEEQLIAQIRNAQKRVEALEKVSARLEN